MDKSILNNNVLTKQEKLAQKKKDVSKSKTKTSKTKTRDKISKTIKISNDPDKQIIKNVKESATNSKKPMDDKDIDQIKDFETLKERYESEKDIIKNLYSNKNHHLYLYDEINNATVFELKKQFLELHKIQSSPLELEDDPDQSLYYHKKPIVVHINSPGGDLNAGISLSNIICQSTMEVYIVIEGTSASAATFVSVIAGHRYILPYSLILIHEFFETISTKYEGLKFEANVGKKIMDMFVSMYMKRTNLSREKLKMILKRDIYLDKKDILRYNMVDGIINKNRDFKDYFRKYPDYDWTEKDFKDFRFKDMHYYYNIFYFYKTQEDLDKHTIYNKSLDLVKIIHGGMLSDNTSLPIMIRLSDSTDVDYFSSIYGILPVLNAMLISRVPIYVVIDGPIRNFSVLIALCAYKCFIYDKAYITFDFVNLISDFPQFDDIISNTRLERSIILDVINKHSRIPESIKNKLFTDRFLLEPTECVKYGIAHLWKSC